MQMDTSGLKVQQQTEKNTTAHNYRYKYFYNKNKTYHAEKYATKNILKSGLSLGKQATNTIECPVCSSGESQVVAQNAGRRWTDLPVWEDSPGVAVPELMCWTGATFFRSRIRLTRTESGVLIQVMWSVQTVALQANKNPSVLWSRVLTSRHLTVMK